MAQRKTTFNVLVAAGGTGGHIFPAVAVVEQLKRQLNQSLNVLFMGSNARMEKELIPALGYPFIGMSIKGLSKILSMDAAMLPVKIALSVLRSIRVIRRFRPDVVLCTGAYISFPVGVAAWLSGVPLVVMESNVNPGRSNKKLASKATAIVTAFAQSRDYFPRSLHSRLHFLGNPTRNAIQSSLTKQEARIKLGLTAATPTILVFGGSQGARSINVATANFVKEHPNIQVIWQTGKGYGPPSPLPANVLCTEFIDDMGTAYKAADVVVCRSGATTIAELGITGIPAILVPLPSAATNEQMYNATAVVNAGGGVLLENHELAESMGRVVIDMLSNDEARQRMTMALQLLGKPDAAKNAATLLLEIGGWKNNA